MIRRIYANSAQFKGIEFRQGLNLLLADKSDGATDRQTRNRAGKTSLVELIHFLTGANCRPDSIFRTDALVDVTFGMDLDLAGRLVEVERCGRKPSQVAVRGDSERWPLAPTAKKDGPVFSNKDWKELLGALIFGLSGDQGPWAPSFRQLFAYYARRERAGAFHDPMKQSAEQRTADQQVALSFLLGLDWTIPQHWEQVREREDRLKELRKALGEGTLGPSIGSAASLRPQLVFAQDRARGLRESLGTFRVNEQYHDLEAEASDLTRKLRDLSDENAVDRQYVKDLEAASTEETAPAPSDLEAVYREVGVVLPSEVRKRFEDVRLFHESVIRNRRAYLASELRAAQARIRERDAIKEKLDARRAQVMSVLRSSGALEHFTALQSELAKLESEVETLRQRFETAEAVESGTVKLNLERGRLLERLQRDHSEQREVVDHAILTFERISRSLYEDGRSGSLTVALTDNGPEFEIHIQGEKSKGVSNMQVFCFDMTLMLLSAERQRSPGFLVHDSHLFDGVDERQVAKALALGADLSARHGFQYIVTMNTDVVPKELPAGFALEPYILSTRLTDAREDGGLFGVRF